MSRLRVAVVGAGLGGLCLAQGLHGAGVDVRVYERDGVSSGRRQGYRLHVDARAGFALRACLPPDLFQLFLATCGSPSSSMTVLSRRLRPLHETRADPAVDPFAPATLSTCVNRRTLREVLAAGLDERISYGAEFTGYQLDRDGVRLHFADGRQEAADLLVGADGVNSAVRRQYLPQAEITDTGSRCVYGRTPLTEQAVRLLPPALLKGFVAVAGGRIGLAAGLVRLRQRPERAAAEIAPRARLSPVADYLMWAVCADRTDFGVPPARLAELDPAGLHALATELTRSWHPDLRGLLALAEVGDTFLVRVRTSEPVPAWQPSRVTVLGDAIHAMSPARGSGANTALRDAGLLHRTLTRAAPGEDALLAAVGAYETRMREYGYAAVAASRQAEAATAGRRGGALSWLHRRLTARG